MGQPQPGAPQRPREEFFTQSVVTAVTRERTKQRSRACALISRRPYRHKPKAGQRQGPAPAGGGFPHPRTSIVQAVRVLSNERRFDSPRTAKAKPARTCRTAVYRRRTAPGQPKPAQATPRSKPSLAPKPGPATRNTRPRRGNQPAESGQSQEPPPHKPDTSTHTPIKQAWDIEQARFRKTGITCLYGQCQATVRCSRNPLTNVSNITTNRDDRHLAFGGGPDPGGRPRDARLWRRPS